MSILLEYYDDSGNAPHEALGRAARRLLNGGALYLGGGVGIEKLVGAQSAASYSVQQAAGKTVKFEGPLSAVMHGFTLAGSSTASDTPGGSAKVTDPAAAARLRELIDSEASNKREIARYERRLAVAAKQPAPFMPGRTAYDDDAWERRRIGELKAELSQMAAERTKLLATGKVEEGALQEVEQARPGTNFTKVPAKNVAKLKGIIEHYKGMEHGFTTCVRDQVKHGLSDDHAKRRCAVVKDLGEGTTKWRKGGKAKVDEHLEYAIAEAWGRIVAVEDTLGAGMSVALVESSGAGWTPQLRVLAEGMRGDYTLLALAGHPLAEAVFGLGEAFTPTAVAQAQGSVIGSGGKVKKKTYADQGKGTPSVSSFDTKKHPHAAAGSANGGQFVQSGSSGAEVRSVQHRIGAKVDGQFGAKTTAAVKRFQREHRLVVDGVVGKQTALALAGHYAKARSTATGALTDHSRTLLSGLRPSKPKKPKGSAPTRQSGGVKVG